MATVETLALGLEASGSDNLSPPLTETPIDTIPITPTRSSARDEFTPLTLRRSDRTKNPSERMREIDEGTDNGTGVDDQNTDHGRKTKGKRGRPPKERQLEVQTETATIPMGQVLQLIHGMATNYETRMEHHMKAYENKIKELLEIGQKNADRIVALETQYQRMMELVKNSVNEQVKMTRTWAQVVASAPAPSNTSPTTPSSRPSLSRSSIDPSSSASQPSHLSQNAIVVDLGRTEERTSDFTQLKDKVNDALAKHDATKEVVCTGVQRRAGGEDRVKLSFASGEMAKTARQHDQWFQEARFGQACILGEQCVQAATEAVAEENGVQIERIRWLSKASDKMYGSVVMFLTHQHEAQALLTKGIMDVGGEMAYTRTTAIKKLGANQPKWSVVNVHKGAMLPKNAHPPVHAAPPVTDPTLPRTERVHGTWSNSAGSILSDAMIKSFKILQANLGKRPGAQHSLMNDEGLQRHGLLMITEPACFVRDDGKVIAPPSYHAQWTQFLPTMAAAGPFPVRSLMYASPDLGARAVPIASPDLTAIQFKIQQRSFLAISAYVPPQDPQALQTAVRQIKEAVRQHGIGCELIITGDFNQHDQLWGGDQVGISRRQGEAQEILDLMDDLNLHLLLPRGMITYESSLGDSTIDLIFTSGALAEDRLTCKPHETEHGSDHVAISTTFVIDLPQSEYRPRKVFRSADWTRIRSAMAQEMGSLPDGVGDDEVEEQSKRLSQLVQRVLDQHVPTSKPSPYAKRWWTLDLTRLRQDYTQARNRYRSVRRSGADDDGLKRLTKEAKKRFHDTVKRQKKCHWDEFLHNNDNIWKAAKYLQSEGAGGFHAIAGLTVQGRTVEDNHDISQLLLQEFFCFYQ